MFHTVLHVQTDMNLSICAQDNFIIKISVTPIILIYNSSKLEKHVL